MPDRQPPPRHALRRRCEHDRPVFEPVEPRLLLDAHPVITEFMASNGATLEDQNGGTPDWIELYNPADAAIALDDYFLTDDADDLTQWRFPAGETLGPGEFLVVFASGTDDPPVAGEELHTNFKLSASGEYLALVYDEPGATPPVAVCDYDYPEQKRDVSYGASAGYDIHATLLEARADARWLVPSEASDVAAAWNTAGFDDSAWNLGPTGLGFESTVPGWEVRNYEASVTVDYLDDAEEVAANPSLRSATYTETAPYIDYYSTGGHGHATATETAFPGFMMGSDNDDFVTHALGTITIPSAGLWTFCVNSDDGFSMKVDGASLEAVTNGQGPLGGDTFSFPGLRGTADTLGVFDVPAAGKYDVDVLFYEYGGGAALEVWGAQGDHDAWNGTDFDLVGDTGTGGLAVETDAAGGGTGGGTYEALIGTDVEAAMYETTASAYTRIAFDVADPAALGSLWLRMKYDDGFVAYLNGTKVAERNAPTSPAWNASATAERSDLAAVAYENIDITGLASLQTGTNVLAVQGLNLAAGDSDFLLLPELTDMDALGWIEHYYVPTPRAENGQTYDGYVEDTTFDTDRGFYTAPFDVTIRTDTVGAEIYYTTDGSSPKRDDGGRAVGAVRYTGPVHVDATTTLRAYAVKPGYVPTNVDTQTYVFLADVVTQSPDGERPGGSKVLINAGFEDGTDGFDYADDPFEGTTNPDRADGQHDPAGGYDGGGGLRVDLGPGPVGGGLSGGWSDTFNLAWADTVTVGVRFRLVLGPGYETDEFGEVVLDIDGTRYGSDTNTSLVHLAGDGDPGITQDTRWLQASLNAALGEGNHTITLGAYNNGATESAEWVEAYVDDVTVTAPLWPQEGNAINGQDIDYGMDPDVVTDPTWGPQMEAALLDIPTFSLVMDLEDLFHYQSGIYTHALSRGYTWERPVSVEYIDPETGDTFQEDAGIRIRGGFSRSGSNPKHAFRLFFRGEYGAGKLEYDLWPDEDGATEFDNLDLRTSQNYSWAFQNSNDNTLVRDVFSRDMQREMGQPYTRSDYCHLYVNGQYFGLFQTQERSEADYAASYFGGDADDYDVVKVAADQGHRIEATDGTMDAWTDYYTLVRGASVEFGDGSIAGRDFYLRLQGLNPDGTRNADYPVYLDVDNQVDYLISSMFVGDKDAPISGFLGNDQPNNFYALRDRTGDQGWIYFRHDGEHTLDRGEGGLNADRTGPWSVTAGDNGVNYSNPQWFHHQLCFNDEYRLAFADRVHTYFFNDGLLTEAQNVANLVARAGEIDQAIIAHSARWGDSKKSEGSSPFTKAHWETKVNEIIDHYFPHRNDIFLNQLRTYNSEHDGSGADLPLYPLVAAPTFSQHGGRVPVGFQVTMSAPGDTIWYTTDGSDPRLPGGDVNTASAQAWNGTPVSIDLNTRLRARVLDGGTWSALADALFITDTAYDLRVTEIMYHPAPPTAAEIAAGYDDQDLFEFIEITHTGTSGDVDLLGMELSRGVRFTFGNRVLGPGDRVLVVKDIGAFEARYGTGLSGLVAGEFAGDTNLANGGERLVLSTVDGNVVQDFSYKDGWFDHTDGEGFSLVVRDPLQDTALWDAEDGWQASWTHLGNPGAADPSPLAPGDLVINEVLAHADGPEGDWVEVYNTSAAAIDISGWFLSDDPAALDAWQIPAMAPLAPGEYALFTQADDFGGAFGLSEFGEELHLTSTPDGSSVGGYREDEFFGASLTGVTFGRHVKSNGGKDFVPMTDPTPGTANTGALIPDVVINEIMYNPTAESVEYIELYNRSGHVVHLHDDESPVNPWRFTDGIAFTFPADAAIPAGGYALVVDIDPAAFRDAYDIPLAVPIYGPYTLNLANDGERVTLSFPGQPEYSNPPPGEPVPYIPYILSEKVTYDDEAPWPTRADNGGSALERIDPAVYGNQADNWQASTAGGTPGAPNLGLDETPPTAPSALAATVTTDRRIDLAWTPADDPESGVDVYRVYRDGLLVGEATTPAWADTDVQAGATYAYHLIAVNRDGLEGDPSNTADATVLAVTDAGVQDATHLDVTFSHAVTAASSEDPANYTLLYGQGNPIGVTDASLQGNDTTVRLTLASPLVDGERHLVSATGIVTESGTAVAPGAAWAFHYGGSGLGSISMEWWHGVPNDDIDSLRNHGAFPDDPDGRENRSLAEIPVDPWDDYGARLIGYVVPSVSGNYTFWISSDDNGELWLSPSQDPAGAALLATVPHWTHSREWNKYSEQRSAPRSLVAGQRYYIEALVNENTGGDNLAVAWKRGSTTISNGEAPIPGSNLMPFFAGSADVTLSLEATDPDASEDGDTGRFTLTRTGNIYGDLLVYYTAAGSADGADYAPALDGWVVIPDGQDTVTLDIAPADDGEIEGDETLVLSLTGSGYYHVDGGTAQVTIADNDTVPPPEVRIDATLPVAAEQGQAPGRFTLTRTGPTDTPLVVSYAVGGTAEAADYTPTLTGSAEIPVGSASTEIEITPVDDEENEEDETLTLTVEADAAYDIQPGGEAAAVTILDNELAAVEDVVLNPDPARTRRTLGDIEPSGIGVRTVEITFSE
ncbi:MAG: lamin tail domain-containing protein, partial [Phycisphaerae bacterium]